MTKLNNPVGRALDAEEIKQVELLRHRLKGEIHPNYDTDFNLYRWIQVAAETVKAKDVLDAAEKSLRNHIRFRNVLKLDDQSTVPGWDENPMYKDQLYPKGHLLNETDKQNRLLWYLEYRTMGAEGIVRKIKSSDMHLYYIWLYEIMLQKVNDHEAKTGKMSGIRHVVDMAGLEVNPFTMIFVSNGSLSYYTNLVHYDNYPNLVSQTEMVNVSKWMYVPYRIVRSVMPHGFVDKCRLYDTDAKEHLLADIQVEHYPSHMGGANPNLRTIPARTVPEHEYVPFDIDKAEMEHLCISARRRKVIPVQVNQERTRISWYFTTDADVYFGVFFADGPEPQSKKAICTDKMEMVFPWHRLSARIIPETGRIVCHKTGIYYLIFCNKNAWITRRNVYLKLEIEANCRVERTLSM